MSISNIDTHTRYISTIDRETQTSLVSIKDKSRTELEEELLQLREEKDLLEKKIKGFLLLSDICKEYKDQLEKLTKEYNQLKLQVKRKSTQMHFEPPKSESPTAGYDPLNDTGMMNGLEFAQRHSLNDQKQLSHQNMSSTESTASHVSNLDSDRQVRTQELFDLVEDPPKASEGSKSIPADNDRGAIQNEAQEKRNDSFPMQESMCQESVAGDDKSLTGLGYHNVTDYDLQSISGRSRSAAHPDLRKLSMTKQPGPDVRQDQTGGWTNDPDIEKLMGSMTLESVTDQPDILSVIKKYTEKQNSRIEQFKRANVILIQKLKSQETKVKSLEEDNRRLLNRVRTLEREKHELTSRQTEAPASPQNGWVQVQKTPEIRLNSSETIPATDIEELRQMNAQLREANQRWSREWGKMEGQYSSRVKELEAERDQLDREKTELKLAEDAKIREYEKLLMAAKQKREDEENAKEEALLQLTSADHKIEAQASQISLLEESVSSLTRQNQALETEIGVVKARAMNATLSSHVTSSSDLATENAVLQQQILVFQEDFDRERNDRAKAQSEKEHYKREVDKYRKRARDAETKQQLAENKLTTTEERNRKLAQDVESLRKQYTELEQSQYSNQLQKQQQQQQQQQRQHQPMYGVQGPYMMTQSPDRRVVYGQVIQPSRPQQYVVNPQMFDQNRVPHITGNITGQQQFLATPGYTPQAQGGGVTKAPFNGTPTRTAGDQELVPGGWPCYQCTYVNYPGRTVCEVCGYIQSPGPNGVFSYRQNGLDEFAMRGEHQQLPRTGTGTGLGDSRQNVT